MSIKSERRLILVFFFISGAAGLVYEVIWTRMFTLVFGNTTSAVSTVLAAFMTGLALGSYYFGKLIDKKKNQLKFYAMLEVGIGITAFLIPISIHYLNYLYALIYNTFSLNYYILSTTRFLMSFLIMLIPATMMGGTLPILSKYFIKRKSEVGSRLGILYSVNTFGAVTGCFFAGFFTIRIFGVNESVYLFAAVNVIIGFFVWLMSRNNVVEEAAHREEIIQPVKIDFYKTEKIMSRRTEFVVMIGYALSGFCALAYQVLWTRIIIYIILVSVYAFTIMLTTFLLGLAAGGYIGGVLSNRFNGLKLFSILQILIGLSTLGTVYLLGDFLEIHSKLALIFEKGGWYKWNLIRFVETGFIIFVPTLLMGALFPVVGMIWTENVKNVGKSIGEVYSFNTIGAVLGSLVAGFIIVPLIGTPKGIMVIAFINLLIGIVIFYLLPTLKLSSKVPIIAVLLVLITTQPFFIKKDKFFNLLNRFEEGCEIIYFKEGISGTITIHKYPDYYNIGKFLCSDGTNIAGTEFMLQTLQKLMGHFPLLLHGNAKQVMQIGYGSGQTSHSILLHNVEKIDVVEISKDVLTTADGYFSELNKGVRKDSRFNSIIMDGKNYAILTNKKYDVITNDAIYPTKPASAGLFTRDHFISISNRLKENGVATTWIPIDLTLNDFKIVLKTFQSVFPYSYFWFLNNSKNKQSYLIGMKKRLKIDYNHLVKIMSNEEIKKDLAEINLSNPLAFLDGFILDEKDIKELTRDVPINTDNKPVIEFSQTMMRDRNKCVIANISEMMKFKKTVFPYLANIGENERYKDSIKKELEKYSEATKHTIEGHLADRMGIPGKRRQEYYEALKINPDDLNAKFLLKEIEKEEIILKRKIEAAPENVKNYSELASHYVKENKLEESINYLKKVIEFDPNDTEAYIGLGVAYLRLGEKNNALDIFSKAISTNPINGNLRFRIADFYNESGMYISALRELEEAKKLNPENADIRYNLGNGYLRNNEIGKAINEYKEAIRINPNDVSFHNNLAYCYSMTGLHEDALDEYKITIELDPDDPDLRFNSFLAFLRLKKVDEAIFQLKQTIRLNPKYIKAYSNLGQIYNNLGRFDEALEMYKKTIETDSTYAPVYWVMAASYRKIGMKKEAITSLKNYIKYVSNQTDINNAEEIIKELRK